MRNDAENVCADASWFLSNFDSRRREFFYVRTDRERLDATAFHDGRASLSISRATKRISVDNALRWQSKQLQRNRVNRLIVHSSFCGSTLLARALGDLEHAVSYREPQALIECADFVARGPSTDESGWSQLIRFVVGQYQKSWDSNEIAFVKPSNWVTWHLAEAVDRIGPTRVILVSQDLESYLLANLRGGKARLRYSLEVLNSFARSDHRYGSLIESIEQADISPMARVLRLLALCFRIQELAMQKIQVSCDSNLTLALSRLEIVSNPDASLEKAALLFDIPFDTRSIGRTAAARCRHNAKSDSGDSWSAKKEASENSSLWIEFGAELSDTICWSNCEISAAEAR